MKNKKLNYEIKFDRIKVSKEEQMRLWAELVFTLKKLHYEEKVKQNIDSIRDDRTFKNI